MYRNIVLEANILWWHKCFAKNTAGPLKRPGPRFISDLPE